MLVVNCADGQFYISQNHHTMEEALQYERNCSNEHLKMLNSDTSKPTSVTNIDGFSPRGGRDGPALEPGSTLETPIHGRSIQ